MDATITELAMDYRDLVIEWRSTQHAGRANRLFERVNRLSTTLRGTAEGRGLLTGLMYDADARVRITATLDCLVAQIGQTVVQAEEDAFEFWAQAA
jgi:hypothetical protein